VPFTLEPVPVNLPQKVHDVTFPQRQLPAQSRHQHDLEPREHTTVELTNVIKIDPYNFDLYRFKIFAIFETQCVVT